MTNAPTPAGMAVKPLYDALGYLHDPEGLSRMRSALLDTPDWHDRAPINCNSLARLLDTIEALKLAAQSSAGAERGFDPFGTGLSEPRIGPAPGLTAGDGGGAVKLLRDLKSRLMHHRRFGNDGLNEHRRMCATVEGDIEEWLIDHGYQKSADREPLATPIQPDSGGVVEAWAVYARAMCESEGKNWTSLDNSREDCQRWFKSGRAIAALRTEPTGGGEGA